MPSREQEIRSKIAYFTNPQLYRPSEIIGQSVLVPQSRGVYGWYFNSLPPFIPEDDYIVANGNMLLYIGIAGSSESSKSTLQKRIVRNHLGGRANSSTFRRTLGSLLADELELQPQKYGTVNNRKLHFGNEGEARLTNWLLDHALVAWIVDSCPAEIETEILTHRKYPLPLKVKGTVKSGVRDTIQKLRAKYLRLVWP